MPIPFGDLAMPSSDARSRCLEDAALILDEGVRVFGRRVPTGSGKSWTFDPLTELNWPATEPWWKIDIRSDARLSDVKFVWEAARHRDLVVLARAAHLEPEGRWLDGLTALLQSWCQECQPEQGVNWYSSLELALRAISWNQVLQLCGERLPDPLRAEMDHQLVASARHIMLELPYTVSSMKNNHLLGDGLGLVVLGRMFPTHRASTRWQRVGDRLFHAQLRRHMRPDGSMIEDSLSYHRFVLEMLVVRTLLGDPSDECQRALEGASVHLERLGVLAGDVPQYGDWDEGRVLADSSPAGSVRGSTLAGLALSGRAVDSPAWVEHDELTWYVPRVDRTPGGVALVPLRRAGDFEVIEHGPWRVWFKVTGGPSHQHADVSSVWIQRNGCWITRDPGTGTYNGPLDVRNGFRTSGAHPVWRPDDLDQLVPHRAFRWLRTVRGFAAPTRLLGTTAVAFSWHDAFVDDEVGSRVARAVLVTGDAVIVVDNVERPGGAVWTMTVPLGDETPQTELFGLERALSVDGCKSPFIGWYSETYGHWQPAIWLTARLHGSTAVWGCGSDPKAEIHDSTIALGDLSLSVTWSERGATLELDGREGRHRIEVLDD